MCRRLERVDALARSRWLPALQARIEPEHPRCSTWNTSEAQIAQPPCPGSWRSRAVPGSCRRMVRSVAGSHCNPPASSGLAPARRCRFGGWCLGLVACGRVALYRGLSSRPDVEALRRGQDRVPSSGQVSGRPRMACCCPAFDEPQVVSLGRLRTGCTAGGLLWGGPQVAWLWIERPWSGRSSGSWSAVWRMAWASSPAYASGLAPARAGLPVRCAGCTVVGRVPWSGRSSGSGINSLVACWSNPGSVI